MKTVFKLNLSLILCLVFLNSGCSNNTHRNLSVIESRPSINLTPIPKEWLHSKVTLKEIKTAKDLIEPIGEDWMYFKSVLMPTDELWYFTSSSDSFSNLAGRMGYVIVRNGKQYANIIAIMN